MTKTLTLLTVYFALSFASQAQELQRASTPRPAHPRTKTSPTTSTGHNDAFLGSFVLESRRSVGGQELGKGPSSLYVNASETKILLEEKEGERTHRAVLLDLLEHTRYDLPTSSKTGTAIKSAFPRMEPHTGKTDTAQITTTTETRLIDGHACLKVISSTNRGTLISWVAKDIDGSLADLLRILPDDMEGDDRLPFPPGFPLEYEWILPAKDSRLAVRIHTLAREPVDQAVFSLDRYELVPNAPAK